jgi:sugar O-acyltransferase (sialic acid O-acetyltransferase NeuD family)
MKRLAVLGAGGHGKVVAEIAELTGWEEIVFFDDLYPEVKNTGIWHVQGTIDDLVFLADKYTAVIVAIGNNKVRLEKSLCLSSQGFELVTLIHPNSTVSKYANIEAGIVIMAGAIVNPFSSVGLCSIINTSCSIDHDCIIGEGVHISPGVNVAGGVSIGDLSFLGVGVTVKPYVELGRSVTVGAGAVVVNDVSDYQVVKGIPAK